MSEQVFAVIVDNEFVEKYFTNEVELKEYIDDVNSTGSIARAMILPINTLQAILKIQKYSSVYPDANTIMFEAEKLDPSIKENFYQSINGINDYAYAKEYFDYFIENKLLISSDPGFNPDMAHLDNTMTYATYLKRQVAFLNDLIEKLEAN